MSGAVAKAVRRDMRRAMGLSAVERLEQQAEAIAQLQTQVQMHSAMLKSYEAALRVIDDGMRRHYERLTVLELTDAVLIDEV